MNYEFALDKKAIFSLIAGSLAIGVLLFFAGLIVGWQFPSVASPALASTNTQDERAALPQEPVLNEESAAANSGAPRTTKPKVALPKEPANTSAPASASASAAAAPPMMPQAAGAAGEIRIIETTADQTSTAGDEQAAAEPEYVTVQVGVFLDEKEASRLLQQMERKGYAPTFFSGRDAEARQWYAVRIGVYSDKQQATNAAANFAKQEKMKAVVRPAESL